MPAVKKLPRTKDLSRINLYILLVYFPDGLRQKASPYKDLEMNNGDRRDLQQIF